MVHVNRTFNPDAVHNLYTVEDSRFSHNLTIVVFGLELNISSGSPDEFNALHMRVNNSQSLGDLATEPYGYLAGTVVVTPGGEFGRYTYNPLLVSL